MIKKSKLNEKHPKLACALAWWDYYPHKGHIKMKYNIDSETNDDILNMYLKFYKDLVS